MLICPNCSVALPSSLHCHGCSWRGHYRDGLAVLLGDTSFDDEIVRCYRENYDRIACDDLDAKVMSERYIENLAANFCHAVSRCSGAEVCDIGSGKGYLARNLVAQGARQVTAVDISLPYLRRMVGEPGIVPVMADAENLPFADHFDIVVATDVLEHVLNVGSFLYSANRALRTSGHLYLRVPFRENLLSYSPHFGCPYRFTHLRTYDRPLLRQALAEAGFAVTRLWHDGYMLGMTRPLWSRGGWPQKLYQTFERHCSGNGRSPGDVTLRPHALCRLFLRPTVIIAAARKVKSLIPQAGGGMALA